MEVVPSSLRALVTVGRWSVSSLHRIEKFQSRTTGYDGMVAVSHYRCRRDLPRKNRIESSPTNLCYGTVMAAV